MDGWMHACMHAYIHTYIANYIEVGFVQKPGKAEYVAISMGNFEKRLKFRGATLGV